MYTGLLYMKDTTCIKRYMDDNVLGVSKHFNFRGFRIRGENLTKKRDLKIASKMFIFVNYVLVRDMTSSRHILLFTCILEK